MEDNGKGSVTVTNTDLETNNSIKRLKGSVKVESRQNLLNIPYVQKRWFKT